MSHYKVLKNGRYVKDGKFTSPSDVPEIVQTMLEKDSEIEYGDVYIRPKECLYCGMSAKLTRLVNLQTVYLCEEHYYDKSIGQVAQQIRELNQKKQETKVG